MSDEPISPVLAAELRRLEDQMFLQGIGRDSREALGVPAVVMGEIDKMLKEATR